MEISQKIKKKNRPETDETHQIEVSCADSKWFSISVTRCAISTIQPTYSGHDEVVIWPTVLKSKVSPFRKPILRKHAEPSICTVYLLRLALLRKWCILTALSYTDISNLWSCCVFILQFLPPLHPPFSLSLSLSTMQLTTSLSTMQLAKILE